jgi:hypothetical protein
MFNQNQKDGLASVQTSLFTATAGSIGVQNKNSFAGSKNFSVAIKSVAQKSSV